MMNSTTSQAQQNDTNDCSAMEAVNEQVIRDFVNAFNQKDADAVYEAYSEEIVFHSTPLPVPGIEGVRMIGEMMQSAFPDIRHELEAVIAKCDTVVTRGTLTGTHEGEFQGIAPSGASVEFTSIEIRRLQDGKIVEQWDILDLFSLMRQIGVIPSSDETDEK